MLAAVELTMAHTKTLKTFENLVSEYSLTALRFHDISLFSMAIWL